MTVVGSVYRELWINCCYLKNGIRSTAIKRLRLTYLGAAENKARFIASEYAVGKS